MEDISKILHTDPVHPDKPPLSPQGRKKQKKKHAPRDPDKKLARLKKVVADTHRELEEKDSPFRLRIRQEDGDLFIDIVTIDDTGRITQVFVQDISNEDLENLMAHIKSGRGLLLDADA